MNSYIQRIFLIVFPYYPLWIWFVFNFTGKSIDYYKGALWIPLGIYLLISKANRFPAYLIFLLFFTAFHLISVYYFDLLPDETNWVMYLLADNHLMACVIFFIVENTHFDLKFIRSMTRSILIVVMISMVVSIIQTTEPGFMLNPLVDKEQEYLGEGRVFSIFSWVNINSLGITFPILISILLNFYETRHKSFTFIVMAGIIVSFLSRARYVMLSSIVVFSQLFINSSITLKKKLLFVIVLTASLLITINAANYFGFNIQQVIEERILEKDNEMGSAKSRVTSYAVFLIKFPEHPWLGVGPETREDVVRLLGGEAPLIHIGYLSYLYFYGIVGCLFLFSGIFLLIRKAWIIGRKHQFWGGFYGLITFALANVTFVYFDLNEMGIILAVIYLKYFSDLTAETNESLIQS